MAAPIDWLREAEEDLDVVRTLVQGRLHKHACWQAQQAAEKALKALVLKLYGRTPKTHDLEDLVARIRSVDAGFPDPGAPARILSDYYGLVRYPDTRPPGWSVPMSAEAQAALAMAEAIVASVRARIAPPAPPPPPTPPAPAAP